jgi:hypothetical protein
MKQLVAATAIFVFSAITALAADVTGPWKGTADTPNGPIERTFVFKVDGNRLTGETTSQMLGKSTITDGKIDGDNLSFTITAKFDDNELKLNYKGVVSGNEIKFTVEAAGSDQTVVYTVKRVP